MTAIALQVGVPGAAELLIILIIVAILAGIVGRWVYRDARSRGSEWAWQWAVGIVILFLFGLVPGVLGLIIYILVRGDRTDRPA